MSKTVFMAVLDWGLGHATRSIPIINKLLSRGVRVIVGGSGASLKLLQIEFPHLTFHELPAYNIRFAGGSIVGQMITQLPGLIRVIKEEHAHTQQLVQKERVDFIISDNRYGCYSHKVRSIFVGHQLNLQMPTGLGFLSGVINSIHENQLKKFNRIWVPDNASDFQLSGILSKTRLPNVARIGVLSRFGHSEAAGDAYEIVALLSGPEPQRSNLEEMLRKQLKSINKKSLLVKAKPELNQRFTEGHVTEVDHLPAHELEPILKQAIIIVSRSGYSTIMDLATLGKRAIFIPTPGQTEQEYLAAHLMTHGKAYAQQQSGFDLKTALDQSVNFGPLSVTSSEKELEIEVQRLLADEQQ